MGSYSDNSAVTLTQLFLISMLEYLLLGLVIGCQVCALPPSTPPSTTPASTTSTTSAPPSCKADADCDACLAVEGCVFVKYKETSEVCELESKITDDSVKPTVIKEIESCPSSGDDPAPEPEPTTTTTTTAPPDTTTSDTTTSTTTTTTTTTTAAPTTTTTTSPTPTPSTAAPEPVPDTGKGHFDGWSFFGGILLTLGLAAIGLVGFKYYRLRSGTGGNYNRF